MACGRGSSPTPVGAAASSSAVVRSFDEAPAATGVVRKTDRPAKASEKVSVPAGKLIAGSTPGDDGRDPSTEPTLLAVDLGPFSMDRLPYPNDPAKAPRTDVNREEARALCQEKGARLCTELEWERACKGPGNDLYGAGGRWDPACGQDAASCASGFGVLALGGALREWTASDVAPGDREERGRAAVRGAMASAEGVDHRCAHRAGVDSSSKGSDLGFRCCYGAPNAATIPPFKTPETTFSRLSLEISQVARALAASPQLAAYAKDLAFYSEPDAITTVLNKGDAGTAKPGPVLTTGPVLWTPAGNEEIVVMTLRAKGAALVVAFYRLPDDRFRLASSLVLKDEPGPVVLAFSNFNKKRVLWSTCWECQGEDGAVEYRDNRRVVVVQR